MSDRSFGLESVGPEFEKLSERVQFRVTESLELRTAEVAHKLGLRFNDGVRRLAYEIGIEQLEALARRGLRVKP